MLDSDNEIVFITSHEGFQAVCLNILILQSAYFSYRQHYADYLIKLIISKYYVAMIKYI